MVAHFVLVLPFFRGTPMYAENAALRGLFSGVLRAVYINYSVSFTVIIVALHIQVIYKKKKLLAKVEVEQDKLVVKDVSEPKLIDISNVNYQDEAVDAPSINLPSNLGLAGYNLRSKLEPNSSKLLGKRRHLGISQAEGFEDIFSKQTSLVLQTKPYGSSKLVSKPSILETVKEVKSPF